MGPIKGQEDKPRAPHANHEGDNSPVIQIGRYVSHDPNSNEKLKYIEDDAFKRLKNSKSDGGAHHSKKGKASRAGCCRKQ